MAYKKVIFVVAALSLSACATVKMPNLDFLGSGFEEDAKNIDPSIPSVDEAPSIPTDVRSASEWDNSARAMLSIRDGFEVPDVSDEQLTPEELEQRFEDLKAKAQAYKADDPQ